MTDEQVSQDTSTGTVTESVSPGRMLRDGRERLDLTHGQVAERLRLRQQIVVDLEEDRFDKNVAGTFTRGYLRAYARLVGVDEGQVLAAYETLGVNDQPLDMQSFSRRTRQQSHDNRLMLVTYIIGAIIIGSAIIFWLQNNAAQNGEDGVVRQGQGVAERIVEEQNPQVDIEPTAESDVTEATREPIFIDTTLLDRQRPDPVAAQEGSGEPVDTGVEPAEPTNDQAAADQAQQAIADAALAQQAEAEAQQAAGQTQDETPAGSDIPDAELVLVFADDTWIRIEDATGEAIAFGVKPQGHTSALDGQPPYDITLGAPENVTLYFQGSPVDLSSYRAGRVARLSVPVTE